VGRVPGRRGAAAGTVYLSYVFSPAAVGRCPRFPAGNDYLQDGLLPESSKDTLSRGLGNDFIVGDHMPAFEDLNSYAAQASTGC
jgi:hypothetical protein